MMPWSNRKNIEFKLKDGRVISKKVDFIKGSPEQPMTMEECEEKFMKCLKYSIIPIAKDKASQFFRKVEKLEGLKDTGSLLLDLQQ